MPHLDSHNNFIEKTPATEAFQPSDDEARDQMVDRASKKSPTILDLDKIAENTSVERSSDEGSGQHCEFRSSK